MPRKSPENLILAAIAMTATLAFSAAYAEKNESGEQRGGRRGPPPEAIESCEALVEGDSCTFSGRSGEEVTGTCFTPGSDELACRPDDHRGGHGGGRGKDDTES